MPRRGEVTAPAQAATSIEGGTVRGHPVAQRAANPHRLCVTEQGPQARARGSRHGLRGSASPRGRGGIPEVADQDSERSQRTTSRLCGEQSLRH